MMVACWTRGFITAGLLIVASVLSCVVNAAKLDDKKVVVDIDYGVALYNFYQQNYLEAAKVLMAAKELDRLTKQREDANILLGGIYLQYGLHQDAENLFSHLLDEQAPASLRDEI